MNEKILRTLMHLFAIIAPAQGNGTDRRRVVEAFLRPQLNQEGVDAYLKIFDNYYAEAQQRLKKGNEARRNAAISVRIIKICFDIGTQLTLNQKIIVLVQLLEYCPFSLPSWPRSPWLSIWRRFSVRMKGAWTSRLTRFCLP